MIYFDEADALSRTANNKKLLFKLINIFINSDDFTALKKAVDDNDFNAAAIYTHNIKGVAGNLSLTVLYEKIIALEIKINEKQTVNLKDAYMEIMEVLDATVSRLNNFLDDGIG